MGTFAEDCAADLSPSPARPRTRSRWRRCRARSPPTTTAPSRGRSRRSPSPAGRATSSSTRTSSRARPCLDKIPQLKPAFRKDGTVTAANSSSISDGAAALVLMRRSTAERRGSRPLAVIVGHATHAQEPPLFTTAPVGAIEKLYREDRLDDEGGRPLRDQRGVRGGHDGGDERARHRPRQGQRAWRCVCARAIRSARPARESSSRCSERCAGMAGSAESPAFASAAAKRPRWRSNCLDMNGFRARLRYGALARRFLPRVARPDDPPRARRCLRRAGGASRAAGPDAGAVAPCG